MAKMFSTLLKRYDDSAYVIKLKSRFIAYCYIVESCVILVAIIYAGYANLHNPIYGYHLDFKTISVLTGGFALSIFGLVTLVRGHYTIAANLLVVCGFATVWTIIFIGHTHVVSRLDSIVFVIGLLSMMPIIIEKRPVNMLFYAGINILILYGFMFWFHGELKLPYSSIISYLGDNTITIMAVTAISFQVYTINRRALEKAENDLLERKRAEELVRNNEALLGSVLNSAPIAVFVIEPDRVIQNVVGNTAEFLLYTNEEMIGRNTRFLYFSDEEYRQAGRDFLEDSSMENISSEVRWRRKDGVEKWILLSRFPTTALNTFNGWVIAAIDISARRSIEDQLRQSQRIEAIGQLAGGIAHDFNNILAAIIGYTELSKRSISKKNQISTYLESIMQAGIRAKDLVQQILTFSQQFKHEYKPVSVHIVVKEVLKFIRATVPSTIDIKKSIKSNALAMGDPTQIHQVVMNLCTNAAHAMEDEGGILEVELKDELIDSNFSPRSNELSPGPYIHLTVKDTGHGMPPEVLKRIFEPFYTTKERGEGTGLGLSVVHGIIESIGGAIYALSEPGKGSSFDVFLPIVDNRTDTNTTVEEDIPRGAETILLVDDEPALVEIVSHMLESLGYEVVSRIHSTEALNLFRTQPDRFDLAITDMAMPQMSGDKLSKELLSIRNDLPIILCTGFSHQITESKTKELGIKGFLLKPIVIVDLAKMIRRVLEDAL